MSTKYFALLTQLGADKLANAAALGTKIEITHMAVGDGGGSLPTPDTKQTKLINEKRRAAINTLSIDPKNTNQIIAEQVIPEGEGGWWIREIGLFDKDGILIAVGNCAETYKPQLQEGSGRTQTIRMILIVSSANAVTLKIDPSVILATREYVDDSIQKHANSRNHPDATLKEKGFVILSSVVDSNSETHAATPKAVKTAYDFANSANNNANGRVPLTRKVNGKALNADISLNAADVDAYNKAETDAKVHEAKTLANTADQNAANANNNANTRLEKNKNGADIPDKDEFVKNLGLLGTVDLAKNAVPNSRKVNGKALTGDITLSAEDVQGEPRFNTPIDLTGLSSDRYYPVWWRFPSNDGANSWLTIHRWYAEDREKEPFGAGETHLAGLSLQIEGGDTLWGGDAHYLNIKRIRQTYRNTVKNIRYGMMSIARPIEGKYPLYENVKPGDIVECRRFSGCYLRGGLTYHITSNFSDIHYSRKEDEFEISQALESNDNFEIKWMVKSYAIDDPLLGKEYDDTVLPYAYDYAETINLAKNALQRSGGDVTGDITITTDTMLCWRRNTDMAAIGFKNTEDADTDSYMWFRTADNGNEYFKWEHYHVGGAITEWMSLKSDNLRVRGHKVYHEGNAKDDGNGYLKISSPIVEIYSDGSFKINDESEGANVIKLSIGSYNVSGILGYNSDKVWGVYGGISSPKNNNGLELIYIDDEVKKDGSIIIETFHRQHSHLPEKFQNWRIKEIVDDKKIFYNDGEPCDIPFGCRLDVRVQMPEDSVWNQKKSKLQEEINYFNKK